MTKISYLKADNILITRLRKGVLTEKKSEAFLREALKSPIRCKICGGLIHKNQYYRFIKTGKKMVVWEILTMRNLLILTATQLLKINCAKR